jgi:thymidylate kinase
MLHIVIEGPEHSGKSPLIALLGKHLRDHGLDVNIQSEHTHNAEYMDMPTEELIRLLADTKIIITGLRTFS